MNEIYDRNVADRKTITDWANAPLSDTVREYRIEQLAAAFGLPAAYLRRYVTTGAAMGDRLRAEVVLWCEENIDLSPNSPPTGPHWLRDVPTHDG